MKIGYCRVSTTEQNLESQIQFLQSQGCEKIFKEKVSGEKADNREELYNLINFAREGDTVYVTKSE